MMKQADAPIEIHDFLKKLVHEEDSVYEEEYLRNKTVKVRVNSIRILT